MTNNLVILIKNICVTNYLVINLCIRIDKRTLADFYYKS